MERQFHAAFSSMVTYLNVPPYIYRYEDKQYIDKFFETGELLISSFKNYKEYPDNQLGDKTEGTTINVGKTENEKTLITATTVGFNSYCFCTSTILDKELLGIFKRDSVFRIKDPINFTLQIEKCLSRVQEVLFGNCIYLDRKTVIKRIPPIDIEKLKIGDGTNNIPFEKLMEVASPIHGPEQFFIKKIDFQKQSEYRILWNTDRRVNNSVKVICPEAVSSCERIDLD